MDWFQTLLSFLIGVIGGGVVTYFFNVRFHRHVDEQAREARFRGLMKELESNFLLLDSGPLTAHGGKPRLLIDTLQKTQDDWFTLATDLQKSLQELHVKISIFNLKVDLFLAQPLGSDYLFGNFFDVYSLEIKQLLNTCKEELGKNLLAAGLTDKADPDRRAT